MATQILGAIVAIAALFGLFVNADKQPIYTLTGVVGLVGGLILWALGRIECVVQQPTPEQAKRFWIVSTVLLVLNLMVGVGIVLVRLFTSSG